MLCTHYFFNHTHRTLSVLLGLLLSVGTWAGNTFRNPVLWADVPDMDVIRVDSDFYMVSTTMHLMPGAPIMHSRNLVDWSTVGYIFPRLTDSPRYSLRQGTVYGRGQWATSLKYHNGRFYALFAPNDNPGGDTYIMTAGQAAGPWKLVSRLKHFHDASLFFDDDNRVYVVYGTGEMVELSTDLKSVLPGSHVQLFKRPDTERGLLEGSRMVKHNGKYCLLMISWTQGHPRREVCFRADSLHGPYQEKVILETEFGGFGGVGQGTIVDAPDGQWYGMIFQDRGGVGRVPMLMPCRWIEGWPVLGDDNGRVPEEMTKPVPGGASGGIVGSDDFNKPHLSLLWQWNHNPEDQAWSLTSRPGWLRLRTMRVVPNVFLAPNTLTQRMEGPLCEAVVKLDAGHLADGDAAGFSVFQGDAALLKVQREGRRLWMVATTESVSLGKGDKSVTGDDLHTVLRQPLTSKVIWLKINADFRHGHDTATLLFSTDGKHWTTAIDGFKMRFDYTRFFMGSKFGLFCYATKRTGGYADFDYFHYRRLGEP